jgi:hypothetical protein
MFSFIYSLIHSAEDGISPYEQTTAMLRSFLADGAVFGSVGNLVAAVRERIWRDRTVKSHKWRIDRLVGDKSICYKRFCYK